MEDWIRANPLLVAVVAAAAVAVLLVLAIVLLVLWRRARAAAKRSRSGHAAAERERIDLELRLAEQTGRLRIIRELHELVVHSISVVIGQADGARYAASQDPSVAVRTSTVIADAARTTLADLRRVMALVREGEAEGGPQPRLASVRELFGVLRAAGLEVVFRESGRRLELKEGAELAIYRILQEALGNSLAHGGEGTTATVTFTWTADGLEVLVGDDGFRSAARRNGLDPDLEAQQRTYSQEDDLAALTRTPVGRGLTEMRERTELFGGVFSATAVPGVGFSVSAIFPALRDHNGIANVKLGRE